MGVYSHLHMKEKVKAHVSGSRVSVLSEWANWLISHFTNINMAWKVYLCDKLSISI